MRVFKSIFDELSKELPHKEKTVKQKKDLAVERFSLLFATFPFDKYTNHNPSVNADPIYLMALFRTSTGLNSWDYNQWYAYVCA